MSEPAMSDLTYKDDERAAARKLLRAIAYGPPRVGNPTTILNGFVSAAQAHLAAYPDEDSPATEPALRIVPREPTEDELFEIYVKEGICAAMPFRCSLSRRPADGYQAALRIWRERNQR